MATLERYRISKCTYVNTCAAKFFTRTNCLPQKYFVQSPGLMDAASTTKHGCTLPFWAAAADREVPCICRQCQLWQSQPTIVDVSGLSGWTLTSRSRLYCCCGTCSLTASKRVECAFNWCCKASTCPCSCWFSWSACSAVVFQNRISYNMCEREREQEQGMDVRK